MKVGLLRKIPAIARLSLIGAALCAIGWGAAYYWGDGAAALSIGVLLWWELTRADTRNVDHSQPPE